MKEKGKLYKIRMVPEDWTKTKWLGYLWATQSYIYELTRANPMVYAIYAWRTWPK